TGPPFLSLVDTLAKALAVLAIFGGFLFAAALLTSGQQLEPTQRLAFRAIADSDGAIQISKAQELLESPLAPAYTVLDTQRKEYPFWLLTDTFRAIDKDGMALEINSKHIRSAELWLINEHGYIVSYSATGSNGISGFTRDRAGVSLSIPPIDGDLRALVRTSASGPAKITVQLWNSEALSKATNRYNTNGGLLFGCLLMLAGFGALVSLLTLDWAFFIFAGCVITSLRISSYMAGLDMSWMGLPDLEEYPVLSRNIPPEAYAILMIALFRSIFAGELNK